MHRLSSRSFTGRGKTKRRHIEPKSNKSTLGLHHVAKKIAFAAFAVSLLKRKSNQKTRQPNARQSFCPSISSVAWLALARVDMLFLTPCFDCCRLYNATATTPTTMFSKTATAILIASTATPIVLAVPGGGGGPGKSKSVVRQVDLVIDQAQFSATTSQLLAQAHTEQAIQFDETGQVVLFASSLASPHAT